MGLIRTAAVVKAVTPKPGKPGLSPVAKAAVIAKPGKVGRRR